MYESDTRWRVFNPKVEQFRDGESYEDYRATCRCGLCHEKLEPGDEFDMRAVSNYPGYNQLAVLVHRKCIEYDED
jgi:hypothetical protein